MPCVNDSKRLFFVGLSTWTLAQQQAYVPVDHISVNRGSPSNFTCESEGLPITYCIWERQENPVFNIAKMFIEFGTNIRPSQESTSKAGYFLTGDGLERGHCGLKIKRVTHLDNGIFKCTLITWQNRGARIGKVQLNVSGKLNLLFVQNSAVIPLYLYFSKTIFTGI